MTTRASYIKPNSITQKECRQSKQIINDVLELMEITRDDWLEMMFESGCKAVEKGIENKGFAKRLLEDGSLGFWAWWLKLYIDDDAELLTMNRAYIKEHYNELKKAVHQNIVFEYHDFDTDKSYRL